MPARLRTSPLALLALLACGGGDVSLTKSEATLVVTPPLSDAEILPVGASASLPVSLFAIDGDVKVLKISLTNVEGEFFVLEGEDAFTVESEQEVVVDFGYLPTEVGQHFAEARLTTNEEGGGGHLIELRGAATVASLTVSPPLLDFGPVATGDSETRTFTLTNGSELDADPLSLSTSNPAFAITPAAASLGPGESIELTVTFTAPDAAIARGEAGGEGPAGPLPTVMLLANACEEGDPTLYDTDGDGNSACGTDCDDSRADVHPGASELCDGVDQDCDGTIDEETTCYDDDGDGLTESEGDCNDGDPTVSPAMTEDYTNGKDDDCDGVVDYGSADADGDGYGASGGDCDDADASVYPSAPETPDGDDDDCDGIIDEGTTAYDDDGDGYSEDAGDCDDSTTATSPVAAEAADWIDNDCDGTVDEGTTYRDDDGDGFTEVGGDCDDANAAIHPAATEVSGNGIDEDCTSSTGT
jgi:hypothetical protein